MASSYVEYTGDGVTVNYAIPFEFLDRDHVTVKVGGAAATFTWVNDGMITLTAAPAVGAHIFISRTSPSTALVDFTPGFLAEEDLDTAYKHGLYKAAEAVDRADQSVIVDPNTGQLDAVGLRIINAADPVDQQDAVTKAYGDANYGGGAASQAAASAAAAAASALEAAGYADAAAQSAQAAAATVGAVKVTTSDTTAAPLNDTITAGSGITKTVLNPGANETLQLSFNAATALGIEGRLLRRTVYTESGTWTKGADVGRIIVEVVGGGGGGGPSGTTANRGGAGGGGGGYASKLILAGDLNATETVTVGAGGAGGTGTSNGSPGGQSAFGLHCSANGGSGGSSGHLTSFGGPGGGASTGDLNIGGGSGFPTMPLAVSGPGGSSHFGPGGIGVAGNNPGVVGGQRGGGGSGGSCTSTTSQAGGNGAAGVVIVWEFS